MGRFIIDADTRGSGEVVRRLRRRPCSVAPEDLASDGIKFPGGHTGCHRRHHGVTGFGHHTTGPFQTGKILVIVDGHDFNATALPQLARSWRNVRRYVCGLVLNARWKCWRKLVAVPNPLALATKSIEVSSVSNNLWARAIRWRNSH